MPTPDNLNDRDELWQHLRRVLGQRVGAGASAGEAALAELDNAAQLVERVEQLVQENVGMADEVLRTYEQLNLVFEITHQIAHLTQPSEIERVLVSRTAQLLRAAQIWVFAADGREQAYQLRGQMLEAAQLGARPMAAAQIDAVRQQHRVIVVGPGGAPLIAGPLTRLDDRIDVIAFVRGGPPQFNSGDMLLVDSVLSFGGQIISNTELHARLSSMSVEVTRALISAIDKKDRYTSGHSERVGFLSRMIGRKLGLPPAQLRVLEWAGLLHDVGKIGVPEEILNKPGKLTREEFELVKRHPQMGYDILKPIESFESVLAGVLYHHEAPDGSGYPAGLRSEEIPMFARIIHVADIFDAITSTRSYRGRFTFDAAISLLREERGTKVDADVADAFIEAILELRVAQPEKFASLFQVHPEESSDEG